ncbi:MAG: enoyl-CoA hydratase-related protein [Sphingobium sp.]
MDILTLNRPDRLNAFTLPMIAELLAYFGGVGSSSARVVILRGAGRAFCAGMDLDREGRSDDKIPQLMEIQQSLSSIVLAMRRCPQPIVSLLHGAAAGGGFALALATDVRLAAPDLRLIPSFVHIGLSGCDVGTSYFLPRLVGRSLAAEILMTGRTLAADRALRAGLVSDIVPAEDMLEAGMAIAADMLRASPMGLRMTKDVLNLNEDAASLEVAVAIENRTQVLLGQTMDLKEGIAAFREKRVPAYMGR